MDPVAALDLSVPPLGSRARSASLLSQLRQAVAQGRLRAGVQLPSTRALARLCGVSRNTAITVYGLLAAEGYIVVRAQGGTFVADIAPERVPARAKSRREGADDRIAAAWRARQPGAIGVAVPAFEFDFALGVPDQTRFPHDTWRRVAARAQRRLSREAGGYAPPHGQPLLRHAIAAHASFTRAVACEADDVIVTAGAQQAFDLLARVLVTPERTVVAVEDPGYPPLRRALAAARAQIVGVPVDAEGLRVVDLPRTASVVCVTPSHQFPLGVALSAERRKALIDWARQRNASIIEDDYDGEFRHGGRPLDALQTIDGGANVFYVGTFSKSLSPALRLGFVVPPPWARAALICAKQDADWHCPVAQQETLASFIADGHLVRHVRRMRRLYAERRAALIEATRRHLGLRLVALPSECGLHMSFEYAARTRSDDLVQRARRAGVNLMPLESFAAGTPQHRGIAMGLGRIETARIEAAVRRLSRAWS